MKLIKPTNEYEQQIRVYRQEFLDSGDSMDGTNHLRRYEKPSDWITYIASKEDLQYIYVREADDKIVGMIQIRRISNPYLEKFGGHIGYSVAPSERRKGYATQMLRTALPKCRELGLDKVLISCIKGNEGSRKTILNNGGEYESTVYDSEIEWTDLERYWIHLVD